MRQGTLNQDTSTQIDTPFSMFRSIEYALTQINMKTKHKIEFSINFKNFNMFMVYIKSYESTDVDLRTYFHVHSGTDALPAVI